jgi:hypothetical protein
VTALALPSLLPGQLHEHGIVLPPDLTYDQWADALRNAEWIERASPWWLCDLLEYGKRFGEDASQAYPTFEEDATGARQAKLKQAAWMAEKFPPQERVAGLSYTHHRAVAELEPDDRRALLREAVEEGLSTRELITRVTERQAAIRLDATAGTSEPVCAADGGWTPTTDDLSEDAAARLRFEIGMRRVRHPDDFGAGWVAALAWVEALDCFKRD